MIRLLLLFVCLNFLTSCMEGGASHNPPYVYLSTSPSNQKAIEEKLLNCAVEATQKVPSNTVVGSDPVINLPIRCSTFGTQTSCSGGPSGGQVYSYDANDSLRDQVRLQCLKNVGIQRTFVFGESALCPDSSQWAGWFDGRLTAEELATLAWRQLSWVLFGNSPVMGRSGKMCVLKGSQNDTDAGVMSNLHYYPEHFVQLSAEDKSALVSRSELIYPLMPSFYRTMLSSMTYQSLVTKIQITIDFCTKKISSEEYANQLVFSMRQAELKGLLPKDLPYSSYADTCEKGNLNFM